MTTSVDAVPILQEADERGAGVFESQRVLPKSRSKVMMLLSVAVLLACVMAIGLRGKSEAVKANLQWPVGLDLNVPDDVRVDWYAFTHVGNPAMLPDILKYPLDELVNGDGDKGILVLYVMHSDKFKLLLDHIDDLVENPDQELPDELVELHEHCRNHMELANQNEQPLNRVRILTPYDFKESLLSVRHRLGPKVFSEYLGHTTYDAPKFAGALINLRAFGNDMPVFRFDIDILFNKYTKDDMSSIKNALTQATKDVHACNEDPWVQSFLVSQQYGGMKSEDSAKFDAWNEAYSTRVNPGLLATEAMTNPSQWKEDGGWGKYTPSPEELQQATNEDVLMAFYGLRKVEGEEYLQPTVPSNAESAEERAALDILVLGNTYIGANPSRAVISGAALAMGPGTAVDMPPFLHTDLNIMWIDDHIFDRLEQEVAGTKRHPRAKGVGTARVIKARGIPKNPAKFTLEIYMPTLMYGIIVDAWVNNHTHGFLLKFDPQDLPDSPELEKVYAEQMVPEAQGPWSRAIQEVRHTGNMITDEEIKEFSKDLWIAAMERAKDTYWQWSKLPQVEIDGKNTSTFATLWGTGRICEVKNLANYCDNEDFQKLGSGLVTPEWDKKAKDAKSRTELPALTRDDINPALAKKIDMLVDGAIVHMRWILTWPDVVQAIRNERMNLVASDAMYYDPAAVPKLNVEIADFAHSTA